MPAKAAGLAVYLEVSAKRVFAAAPDWPGWCRAGKDAEAALEALATYAPRYSRVAAAADIRFPSATGFDVVERVTGNATTDFGAPAIAIKADWELLTNARAERLAILVDASWKVLDETVGKSPAVLRKGPRGGGRDRDKMLGHVLDAEVAYTSKLGVRGLRTPDLHDRTTITAHRDAVLAALRDAAGQPGPKTGWPAPYGARRIAWHVLDHAWEMEDRAADPLLLVPSGQV